MKVGMPQWFQRAREQGVKITKYFTASQHQDIIFNLSLAYTEHRTP